MAEKKCKRHWWLLAKEECKADDNRGVVRRTIWGLFRKFGVILFTLQVLAFIFLLLFLIWFIKNHILVR